MCGGHRHRQLGEDEARPAKKTNEHVLCMLLVLYSEHNGLGSVLELDGTKVNRFGRTTTGKSGDETIMIRIFCDVL